MKPLGLLAIALIAGALALLLNAPAISAFWSPISPVAPECVQLDDPCDYFSCCVRRYGFGGPCDAALAPDMDCSPAVADPLERPAPPKVHGYSRADPAHGEYRPPMCWAVAPGRLFCVWENVWSAPAMGE